MFSRRSFSRQSHRLFKRTQVPRNHGIPSAPPAASTSQKLPSPKKTTNGLEAGTTSVSASLPHQGNRTKRVGRGSVPGIVAGGVGLAFSRRRWGLAVTCACVVRHCACVLAPPMGAITSGGLHVIGRIAPDRLGLNLPDRVFRLVGHKPRLGAGRPSSPCHCRRCPTGVYRRPVGQSCASAGA